MQHSRTAQPRLVLIGGFLGAGKTTAVIEFGKWLQERKGVRVGVISNDQAEHLVDTQLFRDACLDAREIAGGCFCCRSDVLMDVVTKFRRGKRPEVLLAEAVGSCTDLVATVVAPIRFIYKQRLELAPLSVLVDPVRAIQTLDPAASAGKSGLSEDVRYIYQKQLEEAEIVVINKTELVNTVRLLKLETLIKAVNPRATLLRVSHRDRKNLETWWAHIMGSTSNLSRTMDVDYERYARGEAQLAWYNGVRELSQNGRDKSKHLTLCQCLRRLGDWLRASANQYGIRVAHLKLRLASAKEPSAPENDGHIAVLQWVHDCSEPAFTHQSGQFFLKGQLTVNARAEGKPDSMCLWIERSIEQLGKQLEIRDVSTQCFAPSKPTPRYRISML